MMNESRFPIDCGDDDDDDDRRQRRHQRRQRRHQRRQHYQHDRPRRLADFAIHCAALTAWMPLWEQTRDGNGFDPIARVRIHLIGVPAPVLLDVVMRVGPFEERAVFGLSPFPFGPPEQRFAAVLEELEKTRERLLRRLAATMADEAIGRDFEDDKDESSSQHGGF